MTLAELAASLYLVFITGVILFVVMMGLAAATEWVVRWLQKRRR